MPDFSVLIPGEDALKQVFTNIPTGESICCPTLCQEPHNWYYHIYMYIWENASGLCAHKKKISLYLKYEILRPKPVGPHTVKASSCSETDCKICFLR